MNGYFQQPMNPGFVPGVQPNNMAGGHKVQSTLTAEQIATLRKDVGEFKLSITEDDVLRAKCNHRDVNGVSTLVGTEDGGLRCAICGHSFHMVDGLSDDDVKQSVENITNILQTIKLLYLSLNPELSGEFFQIIPFIEKIPKMYQIASSDFRKYTNATGFVNNAQNNAFQIFNALVSPQSVNPYMPQGNYYNPQYTGGFQQPQMNNYAFGSTPQQTGFNPFYNNAGAMNQPFAQSQGFAPQMMQPQYTGQPMMGAPTTNGFSLNPQGAASPQAIAPPAQATPVASQPTQSVQTDSKQEKK